MENEQACIEALQEGQKEFFSDLYDAYFQRIYNHIFYKTLDQSLTEDIVSDTFLRAFDKIDQFSYRSENSFRSWLYTIANNLLLDSYKKINPDSLDESFDYVGDENITQDQQNRYLSKQLLDILETLGEAKKDIVVMRLREGLSYEEIEGITGRSSTSLRKDFSIAIKTLQVAAAKLGTLLLFFISSLLP